MFKLKNGITLVALIVTVIILLVLAGVVVNLSLGENGIINKSKISVGKYENEQEYEKTAVAEYEKQIDNARDTITIDKSEYDQMKSDIELLKNKNFIIEKIGQATGTNAINFDVSKYDALYIKLKEGRYSQFEETTIYTYELENGIHWIRGGPETSKVSGRWSYVWINNLSSIKIGDVASDGVHCTDTSVLTLYGIKY